MIRAWATFTLDDWDTFSFADWDTFLLDPIEAVAVVNTFFNVEVQAAFQPGIEQGLAVCNMAMGRPASVEAGRAFNPGIEQGQVVTNMEIGRAFNAGTEQGTVDQ